MAHRGKLTDEQVVVLRKEYAAHVVRAKGMGLKRAKNGYRHWVAKKYGITTNSVKKIVAGTNFPHIRME